MTEDQFNKLPKWAQTEIIVLKNQLQTAQEISYTLSGTTPTRIRWGYENGTISESYGYIRDTETIFFQTQERRGMIRIRLVDQGKAININADGSLNIEPYSTNDVKIRIAE